MAQPRFFVEALSAGVLQLAEEEARHALRSRRLSVDDPVSLFDGLGHEAAGRISTANRGEVAIRVETVAVRPRPVPGIVLAVALPKGPRQDVLVEKCAELGVAGIQPLVTQRSVAGASDHKIEKWRRTAIEACKQSGQAWLPEIMPLKKLSEALAELPRFDRAWLALAETECGPACAPLARALDLADARTVVAFVGPEGGWEPGEIEQMVAAGCRPVSLGPNTLRIETAAIVLAAAIHSLMRSVSD